MENNTPLPYSIYVVLHPVRKFSRQLARQATPEEGGQVWLRWALVLAFVYI